MAINRTTAAPTFVPGGMFTPSSFGPLYESIYLSEKDAIDKDKDDDDEASEDEVNHAFKKHLKSKHKKSSCDDDDDDDKKEVKEDYKEYLSYLYDDELDEVVDETIEAMYEEGYDLDEIESAFDEFLEEATVTMGRGGYAKLSSSESRAKVTSGRGTDLHKKAKRDAIVSAARQRQAQAVKDAPGKAVGRVKSAVKGGVDRARKAVDGAAGDYAAKHKIINSKKGKPLNRSAIGMKQYSKDPAGRRGVRSAVVGHLVDRAKNKISRGAEKVRSGAANLASKVKSSSERAQGGMRSGAESAKKSGKGFIGKVARKVASGAGNLASRLGEEYDVVADYLMEEGYVDNIVSAEVFINNMSEEWAESILEEVYG